MAAVASGAATRLAIAPCGGLVGARWWQWWRRSARQAASAKHWHTVELIKGRRRWLGVRLRCTTGCPQPRLVLAATHVAVVEP